LKPPVHESDDVVVNATVQSENLYASNQGCNANKKDVKLGTLPNNSHFKIDTNSFYSET